MRATAVGLALLLAAAPVAAQVVRQVTDQRTTLSGPGALDDAGTVIWVGTSADFAGENPGHTFQIVRFDPATGAATPITSFPGGTTAVVSVSDDGQWLAFVSPADLVGSNHDESPELYVMASNGTGIAQLTDHPAPNAGSVGAIAMSGDGARVAFVANTDPLGTNPQHLDQLFVVGRDGNGLVQLTTLTAGGVGAIAVSDDGTRIAFAASADPLGSNPDLGGEIFGIDATGQNLRQLTVSPAGFGASAPALSGNGARVAFQSDADPLGTNAVHQTEVFVVDWDGAGLGQLTRTTTVLGITGDPTSQLPSITDDGVWVYYFSNQSAIFPPVNLDGNFEIFRIRNDGTGRTALTSSILDGGSLFPVVAGGGGRVAYYGVGAAVTLDAMDGTGGGQRELLTFDPVFAGSPDVSPDGTRAVWVRTDGLFGGSELWRVDTDGSNPAQVTNLGGGSAASPSVAADDTTIVFSSGADPAAGNADGSDEIFTISADGTGIAQLTSGPAGTTSSNSVVSATGGVVVFDSDADLTGGNPDGSREVFRVDAGGGGLAQLTSGPAGTTSARPRVDATGTWVAFESNADLDGSNPDGSYEVFRVRTGGGGLAAVTSGATGEARRPDLSGAGDRIAFQSARDPLGLNPDGGSEIFLYRTDTAALTELTASTSGASGGAAISGDGGWVYFVSDAPWTENDPDRPSDLYRVPATGGAVERVGALRRGVAAALPGGIELGGSGLAADDAGDVAVFAGLGDFTEDNPDGLPEVWVVDRAAAPRLDVTTTSPTALAWTPGSGPLRYDVVRGDVASLATGALGIVDLGAVTCLEDDSPDANTVGFEDPADPAPGQAFYYVYRGSPGILGGPGSYGASSSGAPRVAGPGDCAP